MVRVTYRRICWDNGNLGLSDPSWERVGEQSGPIRIVPADLIELPELIFPADRPIPRIRKTVKKILGIYFRERVELVLA